LFFKEDKPCDALILPRYPRPALPPFDFEPRAMRLGSNSSQNRTEETAMNNADYAKLSRKQLITQFEQERQEWLEAGMSEADVHRVHFGEEHENGGGGDYRAWLNGRKHTRADRKYSPGTPVAVDTVDPDGAWISGGRGGLDDADFSVDLENALSTLTELQRFCFVEVEMNGRTQQSVADELGKSREDVKYAIGAAKKNLRKFFS
jgi:hypothetical protein